MSSTTEEEHQYYEGKASLAPIPLSVGSAIIRPADKGKIKSNAVEAMHHHAQQQIGMLRKQAEVIMQQVQEIEQRVKISEQIYEADIRFVPQVGNLYHLYQKEPGFVLSMIGPDEWGKKMPYEKFKATVRLLADQSWEIIAQE